MLTLLGLLPLNRVRIQLSKQYMTAARHMTHTRLAPVSFMCTCLNLSHDHLLPSWNHADSAMLTGAKRQPIWLRGHDLWSLCIPESKSPITVSKHSGAEPATGDFQSEDELWQSRVAEKECKDLMRFAQNSIVVRYNELLVEVRIFWLPSKASFSTKWRIRKGLTV